MPETTTPPADGTTGNATTKPEGDAGAAGTTTAPPEAPKTFTQAELDAIVTARLAREKVDPEILRKAAEFDKLEAANQTELEKANTAKERAEAKAKEAADRADRILVKAAIMAEATAQNAADAETVIALLAGNSTIVIDGEDVKGAKEAVAKLLKDKPFLVKAATSANGGEFGGVDQKTLDEKIAEAESKGDFNTSRRLKLGKLAKG